MQGKQDKMRSRSTLLLLVLLAACARSEDASVVAEMNELQPVERVRTPEADDQEVAIGAWREALQEENQALEFGPVGTTPLFSLRCDARRSLFLQRHGTAPVGDLPMMLVTIGSETRRLAMTSAGGTVPMVRASLAPSDPLVDTLATAETPITIRIGDAVPLVLPPGPEIGEFLRNCAAGERPEEAEEGSVAAPGNESAPANEAAPAPSQS